MFTKNFTCTNSQKFLCTHAQFLHKSSKIFVHTCTKIDRRILYTGDRYDDIVNGRIYPHPPEIEMAFNDSSISTPQLEISPKHSSSSVGNSEQVIHSSEPVSKKTSRKKVNSSVELSKGGDLSESKIVYHPTLNNQSTSSVPENEVQARMARLRKYAKELQAES